MSFLCALNYIALTASSGGGGLWAIFPNTRTLHLYYFLNSMCTIIIIKGAISCFQLVSMMGARSCDVRWFDWVSIWVTDSIYNPVKWPENVTYSYFGLHIVASLHD